MTALAHATDPDTSHAAAALLSQPATDRIKAAILDILRESPRAQFQVTRTYFHLRVDNGWPDVKEDSIAKRLSELHKDGFVRDTGRRAAPTPSGRSAAIWEAVEPAA